METEVSKPKPKCVVVDENTHAKLVAAMKAGRFGTLKNTVDVLTDRFLANATNQPAPQAA